MGIGSDQVPQLHDQASNPRGGAGMTQRRTPVAGSGPSAPCSGRRPSDDPYPGPGHRATRIEPRASVGRVPGVEGASRRRAAYRRDRRRHQAHRRHATPALHRPGHRAAVVLVALALAYAYPVRVYLAQQRRSPRCRRPRRAQREGIADKADEVAKWQDDEYVKTQARERLFYVQPGRDAAAGARRPGGRRAGRGHGAARRRRPTAGTTRCGPASPPPNSEPHR